MEMSFEDIRIYRDLPSIGGYVQSPPNREYDKTRMTIDDANDAIAGSSIVRLSMGSGRCYGKNGQQEFLRLPGLTPNEWYTTAELADVEDVAPEGGSAEQAPNTTPE
jgi:hypothetical protein